MVKQEAGWQHWYPFFEQKLHNNTKPAEQSILAENLTNDFTLYWLIYLIVDNQIIKFATFYQNYEINIWRWPFYFLEIIVEVFS